MWERGRKKNSFQNFGWQGCKLLRPYEFCSERPTVNAEATPPVSVDTLPNYTYASFFLIFLITVVHLLTSPHPAQLRVASSSSLSRT